MSFERLTSSANALVAALGIVEPRNKLTQISEHDARRWVAKTFRELRHAIAVGSKPDVKAIAKAVAEHLADPIIEPSPPGKDATPAARTEYAATRAKLVAAYNAAVAGMLPVIEKALAAEKTAFEDHAIEKLPALGEHAVFHEDHGFLDARKYDDNQFPLSTRLNKQAFAGKAEKS